MLIGDFNQTVLGSSIEVLTWKDVRADIAAVNPALSEIVDKINPGKEYRLYRCRYPYGSEVLRRGVFVLPNDQGQLVSIKDDSLSAQVKSDLDYNHHANPVSIVLKGCMELFFQTDTKVSVFGVVPPGPVFGLSFVLGESTCVTQPPFLWGFTAGARSVFMLPKISEAVSHNHLKRAFGLSVDKPEGFMGHWEVFRQLANHSDLVKNPWQCEVIFFSKKWFETLTDEVWQPLHYYLLRQSYLKGGYLHSLLFWNCIYGLLQSKIAIKPSAYIIETVKHILAMGVGALPGFAPAVDESMMPVQAIQQAYLDVYRLKSYLPIIMQPQTFVFGQKPARSVYYSLQFPSSFGLTPKTVTGASAMVELSEIQFLLERYLEQLIQDPLNIECTQIYQFMQQAKVDFFHSSVPEQSGLLSMSALQQQDKSFNHILANHPDNQEFPETSSFLRGCVRIAQK